MKYGILNVFCIAFLLLVFPNWSYCQHLELIGRASGTARDICVVNDYAFVCAGGSLLILDLRDNANIVEIGRIDTSGRLEAICVFGNYAYLADSYNLNGGIWIIDISDPKSPQNAAKIPHPANSIRISNSYAYFTSQNFLYIWDISSPKEPKEISRQFIPMEPRNVQITDKYAYIVGWMGRAVVIDISNPYIPKEVSFFQSQDDIPEETKAIDVSDRYAYIAYKHSQSQGLRIIDLSNPSVPKEISLFDTGSEVYDIWVSNNCAYIAAGNAGLIVLDVSDPKNVRKIGSYGIYSIPYKIYISGRYAYALEETYGFYMFDISESSNPRLWGIYRLYREANSIHVVNNYAYVADSSGDPRVIDVSNPEKPLDIGYNRTRQSQRDIHILDNKSYIVRGNVIEISDISDPKSIKHLGNIHVSSLKGSEVNNIYVNSGYIYVADGSYGLQIFDASDLEEAQPIARYQISGEPRGVYVSGIYAYVVTSEGDLLVIDVLDPKKPEKISLCNIPWGANRIYVSGNYAYIVGTSLVGEDASEVGNFRILDVSDPSKPKIIGGHDEPGTQFWKLYVSEKYAYIVGWDFHLIDISNIRTPKMVAFYDTPEQSKDIYVIGEYIYIADGSGGLCILRYNEKQDSKNRF